VSEAGEGRLVTVQRNTDFQDCMSPGRHRREFVFKPHPTEFRVTPATSNNVSYRECKGVQRADPKHSVIKAKLCKDLFIVAQLNGRVSLYKYDDEVKTSTFNIQDNKTEWDFEL